MSVFGDSFISLFAFSHFFFRSLILYIFPISVEVTDGLKISFSGGTVGCGNYARTTVVNLKCDKGNSAITV